MGRTKVNHYYIPAGDQEEKIGSMLTMLELGAIASTFRKSKEETERAKGTTYDFLESILEKEIVSRESNRITRWIQQAHFPYKKTISQFDFPFQPSIDEKMINELHSCRFIKAGESVIFLGPSGVGKTHLAIGLGMEAINQGYDVRFIDLNTLISLVAKEQDENAPRLLRSLMIPRLLILDEIDNFNPGSNISAFLSKLITDRLGKKLSIIFTSNRRFVEWEGLFRDKVQASRIIDRIYGSSIIANINGESYRAVRERKQLSISTPSSVSGVASTTPRSFTTVKTKVL